MVILPHLAPKFFRRVPMATRPNQAKVLGLIVLLVVCLSSTFTSYSSYLNNGIVPMLSPPTQTICAQVREEVKQCEQMNRADGSAPPSSMCSEERYRVTKCEQVVRSAYRRINIYGCVREIQASAICKLEWCDGVDSRIGDRYQAMEECTEQCIIVNEKLEQCIKKYVNRFLSKAGLISYNTS